jgi:hypothetical protein
MLTLKLDGGNFIFENDSNPVGSFNMKFVSLTPPVVEASVVFNPEVSMEDRSFFFRATLFKLQSSTPVTLKIQSTDPRLLPFGFTEDDGYMIINTDKINLHTNCKSKH